VSLLDLAAQHVKSASSQLELVENLRKNGILLDKDVEAVLKRLDRALFVPNVAKASQVGTSYAEPYESGPVKIHASSGSTMSSIHHHAVVLSALFEGFDRYKDEKVDAEALDLGCGTGYLTAAMSLLMKAKGFEVKRVLGVEMVPSLVSWAETCIQKALKESEAKPLHFACSSDIGEEEFDLIHVGFAVPSKGDFFHQLVEKNLRRGGRLIVPRLDESTGAQNLVVLNKNLDRQIASEIVMDNVFCQDMQNDIFDEEGAALTHADRLKKVKNDLEEWKQGFQAVKGRNPSKEELLGNDTFKEFQRLRRKEWK